MTSSVHLPSILVVGGCGFLGHHIVQLLQKQHPSTPLSVLDLFTNHNRVSGVAYHNGDITKPEEVRAAYRASKAQIVINTVSPTPESGKEMLDKVNIVGTKTLLNVAAEEKVSCFVYTSSGSVVQEGEMDLINVDETFPVPKQNKDLYADSKVLIDDDTHTHTAN